MKENFPIGLMISYRLSYTSQNAEAAVQSYSTE